MSKLLMLSGLPASGKSTRAEEIVKKSNWIRVNRDLLRTMLHFDKFSGHNEELTVSAEKAIASMALLTGISVVVDDTNLNPKNKVMWSDLARLNNASFETEFVDCHIKTCIKRDQARTKKVGESVIKKMALQYLDYMKGEQAIICDLDGTLCDISHRLDFVSKEPKDWKGFFGAIPEDTIRKNVNEKINNILLRDMKIKLIFVSARPETYRDDTEGWLSINYPYNYDALIMREAHDKRPDTEVKSDIYEKYLKNLNIIKVFDDRPSVIRMWRSKGLDVEDVGNGVEF